MKRPDLKKLLPGDPRVAIPVAVIVAFTFIGFAFLLTSGTDVPAATVSPDPVNSDGAVDNAAPTTTATATAQPTPANPGGCDPISVDGANDWIEWPRNNPERMFAEEAYKFNYNLYWPDHVQSHGVAIERPGQENSTCFQQRFFCSWDGVSKQDGNDAAGFPGDRYADERIHFALPAFKMSELPQEGNDWPIESFRYVAYAVTMDGTYLVTPLDDARVGSGIIEVRHHTKPNNAGFATEHCDPEAAGVI